jgi:hypothetical protein
MSNNDAKTATVVPAWLQGVMAGVLSAVATGAWYAHHIEQRLADELFARPKVVVVDVGALAARESPRDAKALEDALDRTTKLIQRLRDSGYIVLNSKHVLDAPKEVYLENMLTAINPGMATDGTGAR